MKLITRFTNAQTVPARWMRTYGRERSGNQWEEITKKIAVLEAPIDPDTIDVLIGNDTWTCLPQCNECCKHADPIIEIGEELDYDSSTAYLCLPCLKKVVELVDE